MRDGARQAKIIDGVLFDAGPRTSWTHAEANESRYAFLNRSATPFFGEVRRLLDDWLSQVPAQRQADMIGRLRSGTTDDFESAFWELYLHEGYRRCGANVDIHPVIAGSTRQPDFRITFPDRYFYLEAVRVGEAPSDVGERQRLADVQAVLDSLPADKFTLSFSWYDIGPNSLATRKLKTALVNWVARLDHASLMRNAVQFGYFAGPELAWNDAGWRLSFTAVPVQPKLRTGLAGIRGPGEAKIVDNATGLRRALDSKANKYGPLDAHLVIAVLSNTEYPTRPYETLQALYGLSALSPTRAAANPTELAQEGHWLARRGWRRSHAPQTIVACGLHPWHILRTRPQLWQTLEPGVSGPRQPDWLDTVDVNQPEPLIHTGTPLHALFGLPANWLDRDPEFR
jgi:hypothetical protein